LWPVRLLTNGETRPLLPQGAPDVRALNRTELGIRQPLADGGTMSILCAESSLTCQVSDDQGRPVPWAWNLTGASASGSVQAVEPDRIKYRYAGFDYVLRLRHSHDSIRLLGDRTIQIASDVSGKISLLLAARP
jgi:hypothetical protein